MLLILTFEPVRVVLFRVFAHCAKHASGIKHAMDIDSSKEDSPKAPTPKRAKRSRPQLRSGHECIFVEEIPDHLPTECSICLCVLQDPQLVDCSCGAHFCKSCIDPVKAAKKPCPLCKGPFGTVVLDRHLQRTINSLRIYCPFQSDGCDWKGELKSISEHLNASPSDDNKHVGCLYVSRQCTHCKGMFQRRFVVEHEKNQCPKRQVSCEICGEYKSTIDDVTKNHMPRCTSRLVLCPNKCKTRVPSKNVDKHLDTECPLQETDCVFSFAGCSVKLLRKDMEAHIGKDLAHHLSLQAVSHKEAMERQASMQKEIDQLREQLEDKTSTLEDNLDRTKDEVDDLKSQQESLHTHMSVVPVHLVLNDFVVKRKAKEIWHSRPFYSSPRGYKMCLVVHTNGHKDGTNTHLSVYIRLMSGDFDNQVDWPFQGSVFVNLIDQRDDADHWVEKIEFDGEIISGTTPPIRKGNRDTEWGMERFIRQDMLCPNYYDLETDSLHFEVTNVRNNVDCCIM